MLTLLVASLMVKKHFKETSRPLLLKPHFTDSTRRLLLSLRNKRSYWKLCKWIFHLDIQVTRPSFQLCGTFLAASCHSKIIFSQPLCAPFYPERAASRRPPCVPLYTNNTVLQRSSRESHRLEWFCFLEEEKMLSSDLSPSFFPCYLLHHYRNHHCVQFERFPFHCFWCVMRWWQSPQDLLPREHCC